MAIGTVARMAANPSILAKIGGFLKPAFANEAGKLTTRSILERVGPDAFFGGLAALQTPGDIGDKAIAGITSATGGVMGGALAGGLGRKVGFGPNMVTEFGGGYLGDMGGMMIGDALQRGKDIAMGGSGQTGWERMSTEQQALYEEEMKQRILEQYGMISPGTRAEYYVGEDQGFGTGIV